MKKVRRNAVSSLEAATQLVPCPRIDQLAHAAFGKEVLRKVTNVIMPINDIGTGPAFYCVHSITGMATNLHILAKMLGPQQRFYGIQTPTTKRNAAFACSIESISQYYVDELVKFQPEGDFALGGYSVGAIIALEMAQQLRARGREVNLLVVFDGELFNTGADSSARNPLVWLKLFWNLPRWIRDVMVVEFSFKTLCQAVKKKATAMRKTIVARMRDESLVSGHAVEGFIDITRFSVDHAAFMKVLFETQFAYIPKDYHGRVLVFVAKTQALTHLRQIKVAWRKIAPVSEFVDIKGTHTTIMRAPEGFAVAKHLAKRLAAQEPVDHSSRRSADRIFADRQRRRPNCRRVETLG
jgi:thioesterase domain-containing protein